MTNDWKLILKVIMGSVILLVVVIFGLSRMGTSSTGLMADQNQLVNGAKLVAENGETKVTVVNFSDMECPACQVAHEQTKGLNTTPGVKVILRYFPLSVHKYGLISAQAVEAAREMGKGWEMVDLLFSKQGEWSVDPNIETTLVGYAKSLGLDETMFRSKLKSPEVAAAVQEDVNLGNSLQLSGTPTIYVNGEQVGAEFVMDKVNALLKAK